MIHIIITICARIPERTFFTIKVQLCTQRNPDIPLFLFLKQKCLSGRWPICFVGRKLNVCHYSLFLSGPNGVPECQQHRVLCGAFLHHLVPVLSQPCTSLQRPASSLSQHAFPGTGCLAAQQVNAHIFWDVHVSSLPRWNSGLFIRASSDFRLLLPSFSLWLW